MLRRGGEAIFRLIGLILVISDVLHGLILTLISPGIPPKWAMESSLQDTGVIFRMKKKTLKVSSSGY